MASFTFGYGGAYGYRGSLSLAQILYQTSLGDFTYNTDSSGNVVLTNQGNLGTSYDGLDYSGRGIELGALNDVEFPIHHTLGSELLTDVAISAVSGDETSTYTRVSANAFNLAVTVVGTLTNRPYVNTTASLVNGDSFLYTFNAVVNSGTPIITLISKGSTNYTINHTVTNGYNEILIPSDGTRSDINLYFDGTKLFDVSITALSNKQITNPNSYLTYYDFTDGLVTLGNSVDGGSSEELWGSETISLGEWTDNGDGSYTSSTNSTDLAMPAVQLGDLSVGDTILVSFNLIAQDNNTNLSVYSQTSTPNNFTSNDNGIVSYTRIKDSSFNIFRNIVGKVVTVSNISWTKILPISTKYTINTKTVNNVLTHTTNWSAIDRSKIENNPNLVGKLALETLGATKTIAELDMELDQGASADSYYMCSEKSGAYLVDSRVAYSADKESVALVPFTGTTLVDNLDGSYTLTIGNTSASATSPRVTLTATGTTIGNIYNTNFKVELISGVAGIYGFNDGSGTVVGDFTGDTNVITKATEVILPTLYFASTTTGVPTVYKISNVDIYEVLSSSEIDNYAPTIRTNADLQQKGIQTTAFVTDGAGVPTAYSSNLLQFNGDGRYVDTGLMPPSDSAWEIDFVMECKADGTTKVMGINSLTNTNDLIIGQYLTNGLYAFLGTKKLGNEAIVVSDGLHYIRIEFDGSGNGNFVVDNITTYPYTLSDYTYTATEKIFIGNTSRAGAYFASGFDFKYPTGTFQYVSRTRTASERNAYYANLKTIYPTLP